MLRCSVSLRQSQPIQTKSAEAIGHVIIFSRNHNKKVIFKLGSVTGTFTSTFYNDMLMTLFIPSRSWAVALSPLHSTIFICYFSYFTVAHVKIVFKLAVRASHPLVHAAGQRMVHETFLKCYFIL